MSVEEETPWKNGYWFHKAQKCFLYVVYIANEANQAFEPCKIMHKIISYFFCLDNPFVQVLNVVVVVKDNIRCKKGIICIAHKIYKYVVPIV